VRLEKDSASWLDWNNLGILKLLRGRRSIIPLELEGADIQVAGWFDFHANSGAKRAWQIVTHSAPQWTCHWLRGFCEDYLYDGWGFDLLAVADYISVNLQTLQQYVRHRYVSKSPI